MSRRSAIRLLGVALTCAIVGGAASAMYVTRRTSLAPDPASPTTLSPRDIALRSFASVVLVTIEDSRARPIAVGSGFVARKGVVATSLHVLRGGASGTVRLIGDHESAKIAGVLASDPTSDLALLSVPALEAAPLPLSETDATAIGDKVFVVGNPQDLEGTFSEGIVSGKRLLDERRLLQITAPISGGSSGGPVLDGQARVVGVATSSLRSGQNLNFAIPSDYVTALLRSQGEIREIAKVAPATPERPLQTARAGGLLQHLSRWLRWR
jgi:S1-C subfamily serine protease